MSGRRETAVAAVPLWLPTRDELLKAVEDQLTAPAARGPVALFTLNPEIVMRALREPAYRETLAAADWNLVDGIGLELAVRLRARGALPPGVPLGELRHPGADLVFDLAYAAARAGRSVFVLGGAPDRLERACVRLRERVPGLVVNGFSPRGSAGLPLFDQAEIERRLLEERPGVVVACLGAPKQERWIAESRGLLARAGVRIAAGLGGTVDFLSGDVRRAPRFVQGAGMEWLFRLAVEPWRWRRQLGSLPAFAAKTLTSRRLFDGRPRDTGRRAVLHAHYVPPHPSASATRMMSLARHLRAAGVDVTLLTMSEGPMSAEGFPIVRARNRIALMRWLARNPRCPILVSSPPATPAAEVAMAARALGYRVVVDIRDPFVSEALATGDLAPGLRSWIKFQLERRLLRAGHVVSAVSANLLEAMRRLTGARLEDGVVAPNGVDLDVFTRDEAARAEIRGRLGAGDAPVFVYAGILGGKELDRVLEHLAPTLARGARLLMIAIVDRHSEPLRRALDARAQELGVARHVTWVENADTREVARHLSAADIGLNPLPLKRAYCLPVKTFEYLACGLYNLAFGSADGALTQLLDEPVAGRVAHTWEEFSDQAARLARDVEELRRSVPERLVLATRYGRAAANRTLEECLFPARSRP